VEFTSDSTIFTTSLVNEATQNNVLGENGEVDLTFDGAGASGCGEWLSAQGGPAAPNCIYLIRAEQRFGNGDGIYDVDEQTRAFSSYYGSFRNRNFFTDAPRRMRLGLEINF
jgi:hypothetical protein